jgi:hypothetical protein
MRGMLGGIARCARRGSTMSAVIFEHVPVSELPEKWRTHLAKTKDALVTVRIEDEIRSAHAEAFTTDDPAFGIWRDREDIADVAAYVRRIRQPRYNRDGSRNESR